jgi:SAM-dependent methyltransferase
MTETAPRVLGTASHVARLFGGDDSIKTVYGPEGSHVYHFLTRYDEADAEVMLRVVGGRQGSILELACGSGRITFPFLERGHHVVGLDYSPYMLELFRARLEEEKEDGSDYSGQVELIQGDMTDFNVGQTFDTIMLGANAVAYLDPAARASLFERVREHLNPGGSFLMTLIEFPGVEDRTEPFETVVEIPTGADADIPMLLTLLDHVDPNENLRSTNFVCHRVADGAVTDTKIFTALSHVLPAARIASELEEVGLRVKQLHEVASEFGIQASFAVVPKLYLLEAELPA